MTPRTPVAEVLTLAEVAAYLKVTERTIYRLAGAKKIPAFKVGGVWRFSRADIDQWIKLQSMDELDTRDNTSSATVDELNDEDRK